MLAVWCRPCKPSGRPSCSLLIRASLAFPSARRYLSSPSLRSAPWCCSSFLAGLRQPEASAPRVPRGRWLLPLGACHAAGSSDGQRGPRATWPPGGWIGQPGRRLWLICTLLFQVVPWQQPGIGFRSVSLWVRAIFGDRGQMLIDLL